MDHLMFVGVSQAVRQPRSDPQNGLHITEIFKFLPTRLRRLRRLKSRSVGRVFEARLRALLMLAGLEDSAHPTFREQSQIMVTRARISGRTP